MLSSDTKYMLVLSCVCHKFINQTFVIFTIRELPQSTNPDWSKSECYYIVIYHVIQLKQI